MWRFVIGLCSVVSLVYTAPTVHLGESDSNVFNTELPLTLDPIVVTAKPIVETAYVNPVNMNYIPPTTGQQPVFQQPPHPHQPQQLHQPQIYYYYHQQPQYPFMYPNQAQPSLGYQWQDTVPLHQPVIQPTSTNVLPCSNPRHYGGGYQQHGY